MKKTLSTLIISYSFILETDKATFRYSGFANFSVSYYDCQSYMKELIRIKEKMNNTFLEEIKIDLRSKGEDENLAFYNHLTSSINLYGVETGYYSSFVVLKEFPE